MTATVMVNSALGTTEKGSPEEEGSSKGIAVKPDPYKISKYFSQATLVRHVKWEVKKRSQVDGGVSPLPCLHRHTSEIPPVRFQTTAVKQVECLVSQSVESCIYTVP